MGLLEIPGAWRRKPFIELAPDAFVFINKKLAVVICKDCGARRDLRQDISDITVTKNISGSPGSATVSIVAPRHGSINEYYLRDGRPVFTTMSEIEIYMKGRFLAADGNPRYYPVFWGIISDVGYEYSSQAHRITFNCADMLRWLQIQTTNLRPTGVDVQFLGYDVTQTIGHTNIFHNMNVFEIVRFLFRITWADAMGPGLGWSGLTNMSGAHTNEPPPQNLVADDTRMIKYWQKRLESLTRSLKIMGLSGELIVVNDKWQRAHDTPLPYEDPNAGTIGDFQKSWLHDIHGPDYGVLANFCPYDQLSEPVAVEYSERISKLDMINQVKTMISWEFFQDMNGECIFKPPFWNIDVRPNLVQTIEDEDIVSWSFSENEERIACTRLDVVGSWMDKLNHQIDDRFQPRSYYVDYPLTMNFGLRHEVKEARWLRTVPGCYKWAITEMDRMNIDRTSGSITILGRPELRLGYPVYIRPLDAFYYVTGMTHNFSWSSHSFQTTLNLTAGRHKMRKLGNFTDKGLPIELGSLTPSATPDAGTEPLTGFNNVVSQFSNVTNIDPQYKDNQDILKNAAMVYAPQSSNNLDPHVELTDLEKAKYEENLLHNLQATKLGDWQVRENANVTHVDYENNPSVAIPLSDADGYRVYGGMEWGRGLKVNAVGVIEAKGKALSGFTPQGVGVGLPIFLNTEEASSAASLQPDIEQKLQTGDTLLKFEDRITSVSKAAQFQFSLGPSQTEHASPGDIINEQAQEAAALGNPLGLTMCTCKKDTSDIVDAVANKPNPDLNNP